GRLGGGRLGGGRLQARKLRRLFDHVLDQNGDGTLTWSDLQAMARAASWDTELTAEQEARLFAGFGAWWDQLCRGAGIGREEGITRTTFVDVTVAGLRGDAEAYLAAGLDQAIAALFAVADSDQDGYLDQADYRRVFGGHSHPAELAHGFRQLDHDGDGQISAAEFTDGFRAFFTARGKSAAGSHLLGQP
ncbi:MAG: EF-hand domain-containing protein, partial [Catenulispora sp.]|nr:EF-hand domain-containing protein [Catenulispora sp.]